MSNIVRDAAENNFFQLVHLHHGPLTRNVIIYSSLRSMGEKPHFDKINFLYSFIFWLRIQIQGFIFVSKANNP